MAFETAIAKVSWPAADRRDIDKINNPMSVAELQAYAPGVNWDRVLHRRPASRSATAPSSLEKTAITDIAALYAQTPLDTLKAWQAFHVADQGVAVSVEALRRQPVRLHEDAERRHGAAAALEARRDADRHARSASCSAAPTSRPTFPPRPRR